MFSIPFIDIHTHQANADSNIKSLLNVDLIDATSNFQPDQDYSVGIHPWQLENYPLDLLLKKVASFTDNASIRAIGEIGLDKLISTELTTQKTLFQAQIEIAEAINKPVIIHCVRAHEELLQIRFTRNGQIPWIFHGFAKNLQIAERLIASGIFLSFGKLLLQSEKLQEVFFKIPLQHIFLETDDKAISIQEIYAKAAQIKKMEIEDLKRAVADNYNKCFKI